jgi:hypothetical protein
MGQLELMLVCPNGWFCAKAAGAMEVRAIAQDRIKVMRRMANLLGLTGRTFGYPEP